MALIDLKTNLADYGPAKKPSEANPAPVNFLDAGGNDLTTGAKGFTKFAGLPPYDSKFLGISGNTYTYPKTVPAAHRNSVVEVPTANSKFDSGISKFSQQLGYGSRFQFIKDKSVHVSKLFSELGYSEVKRYEDVVQSIKGRPEQSLLYLKSTEKNSPSAIDEQYKKFNLQDESFNPYYIKQPYILRGIQRNANPEPQRWGVNSLADEGLIRAGIAAATERSTVDTARIAQWLASPKGLLWSVKQVGLGLSNPKVETILPVPIGQTRIHSGVSVLASVPTTAFGLHFTRHGLPYLNEEASYSKVQAAKKLQFEAGFETSNRLARLQNELFRTQSTTIGVLRSEIGQEIQSLSYFGGPNSVYGIRSTTIKRVVDTKSNILNNKNNNLNKYFAAGSDTSITINDNTDSRLYKAGNVPNSRDADSESPTSVNLNTALDIRTTDDDIVVKNNPFQTGPNVKINAPFDIRNYATIAYGKIPKDSSTKKDLKGDFRNAIDASPTNNSFLGKQAEDYYRTNNLETLYGFGTPGQVGADRSTPIGDGSFIVEGRRFTGKQDNRRILQKVSTFRGDRITALDINSEGITSLDNIYGKEFKDLIKFYFQDGDQGKNVIPFRCTITGLSDSFSPMWDRVDIMGRPEGAYLYNSFERSISFNFIVAALSRSEMIPMWRKLNYLASYTMPDYGGGQKPSGPFMRITIGDLFQETPGFIESLTYTVPEDSTWDIAEDAANLPDAKQLPMVVEASVNFRIVGDFKPQMMGRVYSLSPRGTRQNKPGQWLLDART